MRLRLSDLALGPVVLAISAVVLLSLACSGGAPAQTPVTAAPAAAQPTTGPAATLPTSAPTLAPAATLPPAPPTTVPATATSAAPTTGGAPPASAPPAAAPTSSGPTTGGAGYISRVVLAQAANPPDYAPVGATTVFQPDQTIHAVVTIQNAPPSTKFKAVWTVVDNGGVDLPSTKIDDSDVKTGGSGNIDFTLVPKARWPAGRYRVQIYAGDLLAQSADFSVAGAPGATGAGSIQSVVLAKATVGDTDQPVNPTNVFSPLDREFHLVVSIQDVAVERDYSAVWYFGNQVLDTDHDKADGTRNVDLKLKQKDQPWPVGSYHVDLYVNGKFDRTIPFSVQ